MSTAFLDALKARSVSVSNTVTASNNAVSRLLAKPVQDKPAANEPPLEVIQVERVLNAGRLDIKFNRIPSWDERQDFQSNGLRIKKVTADYLQWFTIQDTLENCAWLELRLNLSGLLPITETVLGDTTIETTTENTPISNPERSNPVWENYTQQVDALCEALQCTPGDLMLTAIDCLHQKTFQ